MSLSVLREVPRPESGPARDLCVVCPGACPAAEEAFVPGGLPDGCGRTRICRTGTTLYHPGSFAGSVFVVRSGLVKLLQVSASGEERIVRLLKVGHLFGFEALLSRCYSHRAVAAAQSTVCRIPAVALLDRARTDPGAVRMLLAQYQRAIDLADTFLADLNSGSATRRVARLLHFLAGGRDGERIALPRRLEMSEILGIDMCTVSRIIASFRRSGLVEAAGAGRFRCHMAQLLD